MGADSNIEWTTHTFNPWRGCTKVSSGCANCYAETLSGRNPKTLGKWGPNGTRVVASENNTAGWGAPVKWNREAGEQFSIYEDHKHQGGPEYQRPRVFCASLADVFEDWKGPILNSKEEQMFVIRSFAEGRIPMTLDDVRVRLFKLIDATPNLDWLVLTKRPENIIRMTPEIAPSGNLDPIASAPYGHPMRSFRQNLWLGVSVEDQPNADKRLPELLKIPAAVRFVSYEPALGPVDFVLKLGDGATYNTLTGQFHGLKCTGNDGSKFTVETVDKNLPKIDWIIAGGESGHGARPCKVQWARDVRQQCKDAGVAFFMKQMGENIVGDARPAPVRDEVAKTTTIEVMQTLTIRSKKGNLMEEFPEALRVREFPKPRRE